MESDGVFVPDHRLLLPFFCQSVGLCGECLEGMVHAFEGEDPGRDRRGRGGRMQADLHLVQGCAVDGEVVDGGRGKCEGVGVGVFVGGHDSISV